MRFRDRPASLIASIVRAGMARAVAACAMLREGPA